MKKKKIFKLQEVFTHSQPANYTFVERINVNKRFDRALRDPGKQIIIYGHSGVGKTSLYRNKFKFEKIKFIVTNCVTGMTLFDIIIDAFNQLEVFYTSEKTKTESNKIGAGIGASYLGIKASLSAESNGNSTKTAKRAVEFPITPQNLAKFIGESNNCWVIEDFHKINNTDKKGMAQVMKVFMDSSVNYPNLKIIAIGAVNSAREVVKYDPEMKHRISEIEIPLMNIDTLKDIIHTGQKLLNVKFSDTVINKITSYSSGLPAVTHQLASLCCEEDNILKTHSSIKPLGIRANVFDLAIDEYLAENSDSLKLSFEIATRVVHNRKFENPKDLIKAILSTGKENPTIIEIKETIQINYKDYTGKNLKKYLDELTTPERDEIIRYNKDSMTYYFSNPFIRTFSQCVLKTDINHHSINQSTLLKEFKKALTSELEIARQAFLVDFED